MQLTQHTDFSLRVLIYLSLQDKEVITTINEIASHFNILKNHLTKVVHSLAKHGYIKTVRGKNGGISLNVSPDSLYLGNIIRTTEKNTEVINCKKSICPLINNCELKNILNKAENAFFDALNEYTLADINKNPQKIKTLLNLALI